MGSGKRRSAPEEVHGFAECHVSHTPGAMKESDSKKGLTLERHSLQVIVGGLLWLSVTTRPDIPYPVSRVAAVIAKAEPETYAAGARLLRYPKGTAGVGIRFEKTPEN